MYQIPCTLSGLGRENRKRIKSYPCAPVQDKFAMEVRFNDVTVDHLGDIQLLRSHLGGWGWGSGVEGGPAKCECMQTGGGGVTSMQTFVYNFV